MAKTFMGAMAEHFGPKKDNNTAVPKFVGQTLQEFSQELKTLTHEDKLWYADQMRKNGYECEDPKPAV